MTVVTFKVAVFLYIFTFLFAFMHLWPGNVTENNFLIVFTVRLSHFPEYLHVIQNQTLLRKLQRRRRSHEQELK
jgi:hypothetical protein